MVSLYNVNSTIETAFKCAQAMLYLIKGILKLKIHTLSMCTHNWNSNPMMDKKATPARPRSAELDADLVTALVRWRPNEKTKRWQMLRKGQRARLGWSLMA
ncbi:hypothetical protein LWI28_001456 [Acer negundo]|uniref:Uncharacterized protein n=1 Tax=Acer negundo TaxID=4023 RepID=A0AAD5J8Y6_ACENE|nr:hypothetical protein LWI28_001456 [Acer negundo]